MPTLRSQTAASALGNDKKSFDILEQRDATIEGATAFSNTSPPCLGPGTPAQDHEAARVGVPNSAPIIRTSRRLNGMAVVDVTLVEDALALPPLKARKWEALPSCADEGGASLSVCEFSKGKRIDFGYSAEDGDVKMLAEDHKEETAAHQVVEDSDDNAPASLSNSEAGPSHRPQAEVGGRMRGARGRGRRGRAEASRSRFLQMAPDGAFHFAHFNADGDEAPAGVHPPQAANGRRQGRPPRQLNQNRPQPPPQAARVEVPNSAPIINRSRRLNGMAVVEVTRVEDALGLSLRKVWKREALPSRTDEGGASLSVDKFNKGMRKVEEHLEEAFCGYSSEKTSLVGLGAKLDESSPGLKNSDFSSKPSPAFVREACDRGGLVSYSKGKERGRGSRGLEAMLGDGIPGHHPKELFSFDLNHGSTDSDEVHEAPNTDRLLAAGQVSVHLDFDYSAEDGDVKMLAEDHKEETAAHQVVEDSDDNAPASLSNSEAGPYHRPQAEVEGWRRGARGRGRRGRAEASRSRYLQMAQDRAFHFANFNADGDDAPAGVHPPQAANGKQRGRPPRQLNQNRPQPRPQASRVGVPNRAPIIRRSGRLNDVAVVEVGLVEDALVLSPRKASEREALADEGGMILSVNEFNKGKRKAEEHLEEAFSGFSCEKTSLAGLGAKLDESSPGSFNSQVGLKNSDFSSQPGASFLRKACDREGLASSSKDRGSGRGSCGLEAMLGDGIPGHHPKELLSFDLNHSVHGSTISDEVHEAPNTNRLLAAGQVSVHLDFDYSTEDGDVKMLAEIHKEETAAHQVDDDLPASLSDSEAGPSHRPQAEVGGRRRGARGRGRHGGAEASRSRFLQIARDRAFHFAHFNADGDEAPAGVPPQAANGKRRGRPPHQLNQNRPQPPPQAQQADWPGPFSTARQLVNNRAEAAAARQNAGIPGSKVSLVDWHPTRVHGDSALCLKKCPSLQNLCLNVLSSNVENVASLEGVPELFRFQISNAFCERRKMSAKVLSLFFQGEPSELHSLDCTQISEDELTDMMKQISPSRLEKLHLENCGRALSEKCLLATIASPSTVTLLNSISLRGAYRLSDGGLEALLRASPQLVNLDLSTCSFLTNASVKAVACCVGGTLESLVLDGCPNLNATAFVYDLVRMQKLQKISLAEISSVTDEVVSEICVQLGSHLRELVLARCNALTDVAIAAIGPCCPSLQVLDLAHLSLLTDVAIAHITDNLRKIQVLNVRRCKFSDEAIAAFVTASGVALRNLSLNSVHQVADQSILALARHSHACLECLDLSFCRLVDDECLGFLADTCLQLQELKLYGCTQVTDKFLNGHSNLNLKVVGLANSV